MNKSKYLPFIALIGAILLFVWVKQHQRGGIKKEPAIRVRTGTEAGGDLNRDTAHIVYSRHARCRMGCRHIDEAEVKDALLKGDINTQKIEHTEKGISYPVEAVTKDHQHVRIVFAPHGDGVVVVTAIDLDTEWPCDCK